MRCSVYIDFRRDGADADYVAVRADELVPKPASVTHAQAAAAPLSALTAWQALFAQGELDRASAVLIHGGAGGVGSYAVQFARWRGATVVATSSGARCRAGPRTRGRRGHRLPDATLRRHRRATDLVFDTVGGETWERSWDVLRPGGRLVSIAVPRPTEREPENGRRAIWFIVRPDRDDLRAIADLIDAGHVRPIVSAVLPLERGARGVRPRSLGVAGRARSSCQARRRSRQRLSGDRHAEPRCPVRGLPHKLPARSPE